MEQNEEYWKYRKRYDEIGEEITKLYKEQQKIRTLMEKHCNHSNIELVNHNPLEIELGIVDEDEVQYKCKDCWKYFDAQEALSIKILQSIQSKKEVDVE